MGPSTECKLADHNACLNTLNLHDVLGSKRIASNFQLELVIFTTEIGCARCALLVVWRLLVVVWALSVAVFCVDCCVLLDVC